VELVATLQLRDGPAPAAAEHRIQADGARRSPGRLQIHCLTLRSALRLTRARRTDGRGRGLARGGGGNGEREREREGGTRRACPNGMQLWKKRALERGETTNKNWINIIIPFYKFWSVWFYLGSCYGVIPSAGCHIACHRFTS
jgi:hypothetical protein